MKQYLTSVLIYISIWFESKGLNFKVVKNIHCHKTVKGTNKRQYGVLHVLSVQNATQILRNPLKSLGYILGEYVGSQDKINLKCIYNWHS